ncbi:hypothetical protein GIB67_004947 [Kingdonia uniflora]|uniref:Disease resistance protein At4g27190-like leucine-rich repeats domain-containing protein n=1 Tax=Kingdonia uniflora TaxID=39325 RepID=A0A7J7MMC1_9MAGN|nr:hypothetical protein GIB67_035579 [Kingdonia uniflora]KAF6156043.1 hypothetical protein GIB67_004947 [Kingdonia uniflora]
MGKMVLPALGRLEFLEYLNLVDLDSVSPIMGLEVLGVLNGDISAAPVIAFPKLKELSIRKMKHWEEWMIKMTVNITVMPLLQKLTIFRCPMLKSLPHGLSQLKALQTLEVRDCDSLMCMSDELQHLTTLQRLDINKCPILGPRCQEVGEDWGIISHIPNIYIDRKKIQ